jgi:peptidylprolyl isomerase domain and WD repeat-containing protein 1
LLCVEALLQFSDKYDTVISADEGGFVEYWQPLEPFGMPKNVSKLWKYKSETDLYEFKKVLVLLSIDIFLCAHFVLFSRL